MIRRILAGSFLILCLGSPLGIGAVAGGPVADPLALGGMELRFTLNEDYQKDYLGVPAVAKPFLAQVKAERLIIVVFNVFCTICQADASVLNSVHEAIQEDPRLKGKTKLLGIATGNTDLEVEQFQEQHRVPFPLFPDPDFYLERAVVGKLRTPMITIASNVDGKSLEVVKTHFGTIDQVTDLLGGAVSSTTLDRTLVQAQKN